MCHLVSTMHAFACHAGSVTVFVRPVVVRGHLAIRLVGMTA